MSDGHNQSYEAGVDREISLKGIVLTGVVLAVTVVVSGILMWFMSAGLRARLVEADPPPPVLIEAQTQELPPDPRLQTSPEADMRLMRAEEEAALTGYAWVDEAGGIARVPIARAMQMVANQEVPAAATAAPATADEAAAEESGVEGEDG